MRGIAWRGFFKVGRLLVLALVLAALCQRHLVTSYRIAGNSMAPTFWNGDRVVVAHPIPLLVEPTDGDAVIARVRGETLIKRVAAGPGELVEVRAGHLLRNGAPVAEAIPERYLGTADMPPLRLADDEYFLLGDHRRVSIDSRTFGPVRREDIIGRVLFRVEAGPGAAAVASSWFNR